METLMRAAVAKKRLCWAALAVWALGIAGLSAAESGFDPERASLAGTTDRPALDYAPGEAIVFTLTPDFGGAPAPDGLFVDWVRTGDDGREERGRAACADAPVAVATTMDRPGFVRLVARLADADGAPVRRQAAPGGVAFDGGAGVAWRELRGAPEPEDFDAFWARQKDYLASVPLRARVDRLPESTARVDAFAVTVDCAGLRPVTGYLTVPAGAAEKSLPVRMCYYGYNARAPGPPPVADDTRILFHVNAHGMDLGRDPRYYRLFEAAIRSNGHGYAFDPAQNADPETAYFHGMVLRILRAQEFARTLPAWDGATFEVWGGSQGGLQAVWAAALDERVTRCEAFIPWCCDLSGAARAGRQPSEFFPAWTDALGYYDAANHARRIRCPVDLPRAGLGDYVCPPSGVAVLYNNLGAPKRIAWFQGSTHGYVPPAAETFVFEE